MVSFLKRVFVVCLALATGSIPANAQQNVLRLTGVTVSASPTPNGGLSLFNDGYTGDADVYYSTSSLGDSVWVQFKLPSPQVATAYQIYWWQGGSTYGANNILLYGSQDGAAWQLVNQTQGNPPPLAVGFTNATAYLYYRFVFKAYRSTSYLDFNEIQLYNNVLAAPVLAATSPSGTVVNLSWNATLVGSGSYELQRSTNGTDFSLLQTITVPATSYSDTGLAQVTAYWYRIRGVKDAATTEFSTIVKVTTLSDTLKTAPTVTATAGQPGNIAAISWKLSPFTTAGTFQLERSADGINFTILKTVDKSITTYTDTSLVQATNYWYRVKAINYVSSSPYSSLAKITTVSDALVTKPTITAAPGAVGNLANISWTLSPFATTGTFQLERSTDSITFTLLKTFDKSVTSYADSSLARSTSYWYRVKGVNYTSSSPYSANAKVTTISDSLLAAPTLTATPSATIGTQASLTWTLTIALPGRFELERSTDGTTFTLFKTFDKSVTAYTDSTLAPNTPYWYRIRGRNAVSPSPYSPVRKITTRNDSLIAAPSLQANATTGTEVKLSWAFSSTIAGNGGFQVEISTDSVIFTVLGLFPKTVTAYTQESLTPNTTYWYRVKAYNYVNASPYSTIVKVTTNSITGTPADITDDGGRLSVSAENKVNGVTSPTNTEGSAHLIDNNYTTKWLVFTTEDPTGILSAVYKPTGSYVVISYSLTTAGDMPPRDPKNWVFQGSSDSLAWVTLDTRTNQLGATAPRTTTFNYPLADPGTTAYPFYRIQFTADNGATDGITYQVAEWQIFALNPNAPDIPARPVVTATTTNSVALSWTAGTAKPVTEYVLQRSTDGLYFSLIDTLAGSIQSYTDTALYDSTNYYYRLQALGTGGTTVSGWSPVANALTKNTPGTPLTPIGLTANPVFTFVNNAGVNTVLLTWTDRSYNETGFRLERSIDSVNFAALDTLPANTVSFTDSAVWPATTYYYRVAAISGAASSAYSNIAFAHTGGYNTPPVLTLPLLVKKACSSTASVTGYIQGLVPGATAVEQDQTLRVTAVSSADTVSATYFSSYSFVPAIDHGTAIYSFTGSGLGQAGDTATLLVTIKDNGGVNSNGTDSVQVAVKIAFVPLTVTISADKDTLNVPKYSTVVLTAATNYPSSTPNYTWDDAPGIEGSRNNILLNVSPAGTTVYRVTATNIAGCTATAQVTLSANTDRSISNVLTPNGDGKNDTWMIWGITQHQNNSVKVFDRAGRLVFYRQNYSNDWNGTYNGASLDEGAYYYVVDFGDGQKPATGMLTIVRDHK
jgi:gliding motility-associated-like protein